MSHDHDDASYYVPGDLGKFGEIGENASELAKKFFDWYGAVFADGALSAREKSLIALAVAHAIQCPYCIDAYSQGALEKGADLDQMTEAVHVAAAFFTKSSSKNDLWLVPSAGLDAAKTALKLVPGFRAGAMNSGACAITSNRGPRPFGGAPCCRRSCSKASPTAAAIEQWL